MRRLGDPAFNRLGVQGQPWGLGCAGSAGAAEAAAIPIFVAVGTSPGSTVAVTPGLPAGIATDDILILSIGTLNGDAAGIADAGGGTWIETADSPQENATTRITTFWSRYDGVQTAPTTTDSGNHQLAQIAAFRGCTTSGNPWDVTVGYVDNDIDTAYAATGDATTIANCLVALFVQLQNDDMDFGAVWTNGDLSDITEQSNVSTGAGADNRIGLVTGGKATAGLFGTTTNTLTANARKTAIVLALKP